MTTLIISAITILPLIVLGAAVQGAIGFGLAVVVTPMLYAIDPAWVPGPIIVIGMVLSAMTLIRTKASLDPEFLKPALLGRLPGGIIGVYLLIIASQEWLGLGIGLIVLSAVGLSISKLSLPITKSNLFWAGSVSGLFSSVAAIGGPPMALLLNSSQEASKLRQMLSGYFLFSCIISLILLAIAGKFGVEELIRGLLLLPGTWLGFQIGDYLANRLSQQRLKHGVLILCSTAGGILVIQSVLAIIKI